MRQLDFRVNKSLFYYIEGTHLIKYQLENIY